MTNLFQENHDALVKKLAQQYEKDGYQVYVEPENSCLPFDLGSYRPDLLVMKSTEDGYIIEVKTKSNYVVIDRFRELADTVAQHKGWRFLLVTGDDVFSHEIKLLSWEQISAKQRTGKKLLSLGEVEGAFWIFWSAFEAVLRKQAEHVAIPIETLPTNALIKHLYSQGEISMEQFDSGISLLEMRNRLAHGVHVPDLEKMTAALEELLSELLALWVA